MFKSKRIIAALITVIISFSSIKAFANSQEDLQDKINNNKNEINNIQNQQSTIKNQKKVLEGDLEEIINQITTKGNELTSIENKLTDLNSKTKEKENTLKSLNIEIEKTKKNIGIKEKEIELKEAEQKKATDMLGKRLRSLYMSNQTDAFIEFLFQSKSIIDLVERFNTISIVYKHDSNVIKTIKKLQLDLQKAKDILENDKINIEANKKQVETEFAELSSIKAQLVSEKNKYNSKLSELQTIENQKQRTIASLSAKDKELQDKIGDLTAYNSDLERELKELLNQVNNPGNNTGGNGNTPPPSNANFLRPVAGPITSPFGPRIHPVFGDQGFHRGVDYGSPSGTPIKASKAGTVAVSQYSSSYGYFVVINHGNGVQTLYAHASSLNCKVGQQVQQGQVVANVGSTGWSTGPHLHFEIRINGEAVNPQNYIPN